MRYPIILAFLAAFLVSASLDPASAQLADTGNFHIVWEVKNRFRLFRKESDFLHQVAASRGDGVLAEERRLEASNGGVGWAQDVVGNLCLDDYGNLLQTCSRDGANENYLTPRDHAIGVAISGPVPQGETCAWTFDDGSGPLQKVSASCDAEVRLRVRYGHTTVATVDVPLGDGTAQRVATEINVRDLLIAGLGDSIAAGEGDPDQAVQLEGGFCFRRFGGGQYYRPGRAGFTGDRSCENGPANEAAAKDWAHHGARWMSPACHRSLYSYQIRTALALAIEQPHAAVTFLPLACSGASIDTGMFNGQTFDDCPRDVGLDACAGTAPAQLTELKNIMARVHKQDPQRNLDMILLTIGANDVKFASLVANVIVDARTERILLGRGGGIVSVQDAEAALEQNLPAAFARLRAALKPYAGGNLARVVFISYANPAMQAPDKPCPGGRFGLDIHPAFSADATRLRDAANFVDNRFLPTIRALATCDGKNACRDPMTDRMTFVDAHQSEFESHGMCVQGPDDPVFDRQCFSQDGKSFATDLVAASTDPLVCALPPSDYRPYASRARWVRTANDSYFTAMTYPVGIPAMLRPTDIHDALWGVVSAVYGGAIHPTAEGYAAMADAAMPAVRVVLGVPQPPAVSVGTLPPPPGPEQSPAPSPGQPPAAAPALPPPPVQASPAPAVVPPRSP
ncbi:MAG TPA: SGNH/GDSL hydrolase family protein [Xanthobacteraceae bacterium]